MTGLIGATGLGGFTGPVGNTGAGIQGQTGFQGPTGVKGSTGVQGITGVATQGTTGVGSPTIHVFGPTLITTSGVVQSIAHGFLSTPSNALLSAVTINSTYVMTFTLDATNLNITATFSSAPFYVMAIVFA
jgi:hypothetical protein